MPDIPVQIRDESEADYGAVQRLMDAICYFLPCPLDIDKIEGEDPDSGEPIVVHPDSANSDNPSRVETRISSGVNRAQIG